AVLFPYEAAYLAGGPGRVAETALAALVDEGWVEATPSGRLCLGSGGESVELPDPVATGVLAAVPGDRQTAATEVWHRAVRLRDELWGREDAQMAVALRGLRGITDRGLRRGLDRGARAAVKRTPSTALSTPVHNMVGPGDS